MRRERVATVAVAVCALLVVASVAVGLSTSVPRAGHDTDRPTETGFAGVNAPGNPASVPQETLLSRSELPERQPDNRTYRSIVIFRNDDIQSGYRPHAMRAVNEVFVEERVPVTLGVIPPMAGENISETETCSYLRRLKRAHPEGFELSLHGYTHEDLTGFYGASEFGGLPADQQAARIARGKAIMQQCTGLAPQSFVPPFNTYDANTTAALSAHGIHTVSAGDWFTNEYYNRTEPGAFVTRGVVHVPATGSFVENWTTDEFYTQKHLRGRFDRAYRNHSIYVQMLHYPTFDTTEKRARLRNLIRYMKSHNGVTFMTVTEFSRAMRTGTLTRTPDGWRYASATGNASTAGSRPATAAVTANRKPNRSAETVAVSSVFTDPRPTGTARVAS